MRLVPRGDLWRAVLLTPQREGMCVSIKSTYTLGGNERKINLLPFGNVLPSL